MASGKTLVIRRLRRYQSSIELTALFDIFIMGNVCAMHDARICYLSEPVQFGIFIILLSLPF